jgi:tRNA (cmo5U34)-methyltransferase
MSNVGDGITSESGNWTFGGEVPKSFDEHVSKSVPLYFEGHELIYNLSDFFVKNDSIVYEIGCSTGTLIAKLASKFEKRPNIRFFGIDVEESMINHAVFHNKNLKNLEFITDDALNIEFSSSDFIICYYTIQFIRPSLRQILIDKIYDKLNYGGALIMFEKVRGVDARFHDILSMLYNEYKLAKGYSPEDIIGKSRSLKGVLEPFSSQGNVDMLKRAGFVDICSIQKYLCFEGLLAIK